jgi:hypothetical protein
MNRTVAAVLVSLSLGALPLVANAEGSRPDATLEITGKTFAVGIGFTEATGTLQYQGKSYPVQMKGLSVAQIGVSSIKATGEVYHLNSVHDLSGSYAAASAGSALVNGHTETTMKNDKGVVVKMHATTDGVDLRLSADGVWLKLSQ